MMPAATSGMPSRFDIAMLHTNERSTLLMAVTLAQASGTHLTAIEIAGYMSDYDSDLK
jgi:hypothetical protein